VTGHKAAKAEVVDAVLTASRTLVAVAEQSLGAAADETTLAQYRALVVLASRGPQRMVDLARALEVTPSTAGRMCDRLLRKGLIRRHRARADRREVQVSIMAAGRAVVDDATARRKELLAEILGRLTPAQQSAVATAFQAFAVAAGEVPDSQWPDTQWPDGQAPSADRAAGQDGSRRAARPAGTGPPVAAGGGQRERKSPARRPAGR